MGDAAPWVVTVLVGIAAAAVTVLTATTSIFDARSRHGVTGGRLTVRGTRFDIPARWVEFEVMNAGAMAVFGVSGRLDARIDDLPVRCDVAGVDRIAPGEHVSFRGRDLSFLPRPRIPVREDRGLLKLRLTYFDHADARRIENRWFRIEGGGVLKRFRVRHAFTSLG